MTQGNKTPIIKLRIGDGTHQTKRYPLKNFTARGRIPIEKNIIVVDEQGNEHEATYPRRARGLVKNGRARFLSENKICLACPPDKHLEDNKMTDLETGSTIDMAYIFNQIRQIQEQTEYLNNVIKELADMTDGDSGDCGSPGNLLGQAKAHALGDVVRCRETTNQQLLNFYISVYNDLKAMP